MLSSLAQKHRIIHVVRILGSKILLKESPAHGLCQPSTEYFPGCMFYIFSGEPSPGINRSLCEDIFFLSVIWAGHTCSSTALMRLCLIATRICCWFLLNVHLPGPHVLYFPYASQPAQKPHGHFPADAEICVCSCWAEWDCCQSIIPCSFRTGL